MSDKRQIAVAVLLGTIVGALTMPPAPSSPQQRATAPVVGSSAIMAPQPQDAALPVASTSQ